MRGLVTTTQQAQFQVPPRKNILYVKEIPASGYIDVLNIDVVMLYATTSDTLNGFTGGIPGQYLKVIISCSGGANITVANLKTFNGLYNIGDSSFVVESGEEVVKDYFNTNSPLGDNIWWDSILGIDTNTGFYGAFSDFTDQTAAAINTGYPITLNTTDLSNGVTVNNGSEITVAHDGIYNIQWSAQFTNADSQDQDIDIWIKLNGTDVVGSNGQVTVISKHGSVDGHILPAWNYLLELNANDHIQFYWATTSTLVSLQHAPANAIHPATASIIVTVTQQTAVVSGGGGGGGGTLPTDQFVDVVWNTPGAEVSNSIEVSAYSQDLSANTINSNEISVTVTVTDAANDSEPSSTAFISAATSPVGTILAGSGTATAVFKTNSNGQFKIKVTETSAANRYIWIRAGGHFERFVKARDGVLQLTFA